MLVSLLAMGVVASHTTVPTPSLYWVHPTGDTTTIPCAHGPKHSGHRPPNATCLCPKTQQHSGGHDTGKRDPFGNKIMEPCGHLITPHPNGHELPAAPCLHPLHDNGDPGPVIDCLHPLAPVRTDVNLGLVFYTSDSTIQSYVTQAAIRLKAAGLDIGKPRPLHVFYRSPINGNPNDNEDPFWSHYESDHHAIQLTKGRSLDDLKTTARHEIGHALLGHQIVHIKSPGGPHELSDSKNAKLAMSEGWATFVAMYLASDSNAYGIDWELGHLKTDIPFSTKNEFRVGCILWDLYDTNREKVAGKGGDVPGPDTIGLGFAELFKVYSPSLQTLAHGPELTSIDDFISRLKANLGPADQAKLAGIDAVRMLNLNGPGK